MSEPATILVVDDDQAVRDVTRAMLEATGFRARVAENAAAALALVDAGDPVDLALVDFSMPDMDGATLARELLSRRPGLPVILATGYGAGVDGVVREDLIGVLEKPFGLKALKAAIDEALARS